MSVVGVHGRHYPQMGGICGRGLGQRGVACLAPQIPGGQTFAGRVVQEPGGSVGRSGITAIESQPRVTSSDWL